MGLGKVDEVKIECSEELKDDWRRNTDLKPGEKLVGNVSHVDGTVMSNAKGLRNSLSLTVCGLLVA